MPSIPILGNHNATVTRSPLAETIVGLMIATVMLAVFIGLAALVPAVWTSKAGDRASTVRIDELRQCAMLADNAARLSCFDDIAHRPPPHPAKGANAPAAAFTRRTDRL
jgi:hypothetical protein